MKSLKERMSAAAGPAPSMVPQSAPPPPPPKEEEPPPPSLVDLIPNKADYLKLKRLIEQDMPWKVQESQAKRMRKPIETAIKAILGKHQVGLAQEGDIKVNYYNTPRSTLDPKLLLANGVTPDVIIRSKTIKNVYTLKLTVGRGGEEDEDS